MVFTTDFRESLTGLLNEEAKEYCKSDGADMRARLAAAALNEIARLSLCQTHFSIVARVLTGRTEICHA